MSWFKRKPKNRRHGHSTHVLDVKLRADRVRASRVRLTAMALGLVFGTIFGFYIVWRTGEYTLDRLVYENPSFAVQDIDVKTDGVIAPDQLRRWAGVKPGQNLLALDLARVKRDLEMVSTIKSVAVERVLPHTLRLRVTEREPLAQVHLILQRANGATEMNVLHLDSTACVMTQIEPQQRAVPATVTNEFLPVITGINQNELVPGRRLDSPQVAYALLLIQAFERSPMAGVVDMETIDVSAPEILQVKTTQGSQVVFSMQDLDRQLRRWRQIHDQGQRFNKVVATLDLSVPNSIPATWTDAGAAPPVAPRTRNLQPNRKKNV
jgi:cell division septal protein FtsQ